MKKNILITGMPRTGKTTILKKVISRFNKKVGFLTNEILLDNQRTGFEIQTHTNEKAVLASIDFKSNIKVSRYFVNVNNLDLIIPKVSNFSGEDLLYLDEIGQMELYSNDFKELTTNYLNSQNICIATISKIYNDEFTEKIKNRDDVILVEINEENRLIKEKFIQEMIKKIQKAKNYLNEQERININENRATIITNKRKRNLIKEKDGWVCDCEFFIQNKICSHSIALNEFLKNS